MTLNEHLTLDILKPPRYEVPLDDSRDITQGSGLVGILRLDPETLNPQRFGATLRIVRDLQRATPRLPWLLLMWGPSVPVEAARPIAALRCRGVLSPAGQSPDAVHAAVAWDGDLMAHLEHWFRTHTELGHGVWDWLATLVETGYHAAPGDPMPDAIEGAPRIIPATRRAWFHLGRGLRSALALHRHTGESVTRLALKLGFHDRSSLSRHLKRVFGHTLSWIRPRLGWEWLLDDWCRARLEPGLIKSRPAVVTPRDLRNIMRSTDAFRDDSAATAG